MWLRIALAGSLLTLVLHIVVLIANGDNPVVTPISQLSRGQWGELHTLGLGLFGLAHIALAVSLGNLDRGKFWPFARGLLVAAGVGLFYVAYYFATSTNGALYGTSANDPLWIVASVIGLAMGALQPGLSRQSRPLSLFSAICLGLWIWLMPLTLLVNDSWLGAYERLVGGLYVLWMVGIALGLSSLAKEARQQPV